VRSIHIHSGNPRRPIVFTIDGDDACKRALDGDAHNNIPIESATTRGCTRMQGRAKLAGALLLLS
jgi:hypothetical protein